jgi:hypothetical protein
MRISFVGWALPIIFFCQYAHANDIKNFLSKQFTQTPKAQRIWLDKEKQNHIKTVFNPSQTKLSYRFWQKDNKTVWVLDELGKERNITTGIVITDHTIKSVEVISYRESRGGQVQSNRFISQYSDKTINSNLVKEIDSISGATLSVDALNKQVSLALYLNSLIP